MGRETEANAAAGTEMDAGAGAGAESGAGTGMETAGEEESSGIRNINIRKYAE